MLIYMQNILFVKNAEDTSIWFYSVQATLLLPMGGSEDALTIGLNRVVLLKSYHNPAEGVKSGTAMLYHTTSRRVSPRRMSIGVCESVCPGTSRRFGSL